MIMCDTDKEDCLTELNTQLNKSMVLMENATDIVPQQNKSNKSITINTKPQPRTSSTASSNARRKSILKKSDGSTNEETQPNDNEENNSNGTNKSIVHETILVAPTEPLSRPRNLQELIQAERLVPDTTGSTFNFDDISNDDEIFIMDVPRTINPKELKGQTLTLGDKSKLKIAEERYCTVSHEVRCSVTCVLSTGKVKTRYKTVNVKPAGSLSIRRKLSSIPKVKPVPFEKVGVPFPENLKLRHPLFGVVCEDNIEQNERMNTSDVKKKR